MSSHDKVRFRVRVRSEDFGLCLHHDEFLTKLHPVHRAGAAPFAGRVPEVVREFGEVGVVG